MKLLLRGNLISYGNRGVSCVMQSILSVVEVELPQEDFYTIEAFQATVAERKQNKIYAMQSNLSVVEFELPQEDFEALSQLQPQRCMVDGSMFTGEDKPYKVFPLT